ncbi:hypothetical protein AVEN_17597-1 [Araneus ventricosus]|uniref:Uncharacterized protein n=1 Tax=Araneus ventricosus TaxID=182803 RepID=A0A4Y2HXC0_ARAVE|nr:hypothetical protein AVEN_17597-1 [Araneus ventricosus]
MRTVRRTAVQDRNTSVEQIRAVKYSSVPIQTVWNCLFYGGLHSKRPSACLPLISWHYQSRIQRHELIRGPNRTELVDGRMAFLSRYISAGFYHKNAFEMTTESPSLISRLPCKQSYKSECWWNQLVVILSSIAEMIVGGFQYENPKPHTPITTRRIFKDVKTLP